MSKCHMGGGGDLKSAKKCHVLVERQLVEFRSLHYTKNLIIFFYYALRNLILIQPFCKLTFFYRIVSRSFKIGYHQYPLPSPETKAVQNSILPRKDCKKEKKLYFYKIRRKKYYSLCFKTLLMILNSIKQKLMSKFIRTYKRAPLVKQTFLNYINNWK